MLPRHFLTFVIIVVTFSSLCFAETSTRILLTEQKNKNLENAYLLSTGDQVLIEVYGENDLRKEALLSNTGKISYPFIGELLAKGLSVTQLENLIIKRLKGRFLLDPKVTVSILAYRPFFINGEIGKPGGYPFQPGLTIRKAIALAGGFSERASRNKVLVIHESNINKEPVRVNLEDAVHPGDIITVKQSFF